MLLLANIVQKFPAYLAYIYMNIYKECKLSVF